MQCAWKLFKLRLRMPVSVSVVCHVMIVPMRVSDHMCVRRSVVRMRKAVLTQMLVKPDQRVEHNERRAACHSDRRDKISPRELFVQKDRRNVPTNGAAASYALVFTAPGTDCALT